MKKLLLFLITASLPSLIFAYPITPRPLRKLIMESELIVWAYVSEVGEIKQTKKNDHIWERDFARIIVKEILQGELKTDTLTVYFSSGMICPAPGVLFEQEEVLLFLDKHEKMDGYTIHALSYGVKHGLSKQDFAIYKDRIEEMQKILKLQKTPHCNECIVEWLVKCAQQKCTRWEGLYELSPHSDFMSYYDGDTDTRKDLFLNTPQRNSLFDVLMTVDTLDYNDLALVDVVKGLNDSLLLDFLKSRLTRVDQIDLWPASDIMKRIVELTGDTELEELARKFESAWYQHSDKEKSEGKKLLSEFIGRMQKAGPRKTFTAYGKWNA